MAQGAEWTTVPVALGQSPGKFTIVNQAIQNVPPVFNGDQRAGDQAVAFDFDGDRRLDDIAVIGPLRRRLEVYQGMGGGQFQFASAVFTNDLAVTQSHGGFSQDGGVRLLAGNFDGDNLRDDLAIVGGADWCHIPVHIGPAQGAPVFDPTGGTVER